MNPFFKYLFVLFVLLVFTSCSSIERDNTSRFDEGPQVKESRPGVLAEYEAFYVMPIHVYSIQGDVLRRVDEKDAENLADIFRTKIIRELDSKYTSFSQPARKVAHIKVSISDISSTYAALQLRPGYLVPNSMRGGATIEASVVDSVSGKEVLSFKDSRQGEREGFFSGFGKWDGVKRAFDNWARELSDAVH